MMAKSPAARVDQEVTLGIPVCISQESLGSAIIAIPTSPCFCISSSPKCPIEFRIEPVLARVTASPKQLEASSGSVLSPSQWEEERHT